MSPYQSASCVYCKQGLPHEKHVNLLEYTRLFGGFDAYEPTVLVKSTVGSVVASQRKQRIA